MNADSSKDCVQSSSAQSFYDTENMGLPSIEKLDGSSNFSTWKFLMEMYLVQDDLWEYTQEVPKETDIVAVKRDRKTKAKICLMVKPHCLVHVRQAKTAKDAWEALHTAFEDKGLNNRCRLLSKLVSIKLEQFESLRDYVTSMMSVAQQLRELGKEIDDELLAALMLQGLTENFQPMRLAIENSNITLTTDYVKTKLFQMEDSYAANTSSSRERDAALVTKQKPLHKRQNKLQRKIKCFICSGPHKAKECPRNLKQKATVALALGTSKGGTEDWILDSGATNHMTNNRTWLRDYKACDRRVEVMCANGERVYGIGRGLVVSEKPSVTVSDALYVPELSSNLLSVSKITERGYAVVFREKGFQIVRSEGCKIQGDILHSGVINNGVYKLKLSLQHAALVTSTVNDDMELWHRRMGHLGVRNLKILRDKMATGVSFPSTSCSLECVACLKGKQTKQPFKKTEAKRASDILGLVHTDVCGPMSVESLSGKRYFLIFIDDCTRKTFVYFLKSKNEVYEKFKLFKNFAERETGNKLKILRSDNGKEFVNRQMSNFMQEHGIKHQLTVEYTPEQNGVAERANRTIVEKARCMLQQAGLEQKYWAEAVNTTVYLKNRSPTIAVRGKTPEECWTGRKPNLSFARVFGCRAFMHIPDARRTKWEPKSRELMHIGYYEDSKAYRLLNPETGRVYKARDVIFFENQNYYSKPKPQKDSVLIRFDDENSNEFISGRQSADETLKVSENLIQKEGLGIVSEDTKRTVSVSEDSEVTVPALKDSRESVPVSEDAEEIMSIAESTDSDDWASINEEEMLEVTKPVERAKRYPKRDRKPREYPDYVTYQASTQMEEPQSVEEALSRDDKGLWSKAIKEELQALKKNNTWTLVKPPKLCNLVDSKWVFRIKEEAGGKKRYKARLVARGFSQRRGIDYLETFSPVVRHSSLRTLIALAARLGLKIDQMDVKTAFLNGNLQEKVYMKQPDGFVERGKEDYVCLLQKSLYGLKQAPRAWNKKLHQELERLNFMRSENEPCIYIRSGDKLNLVIIAVYVDDLLVFYNNVKDMRKVKSDLMSKFEMKDLGRAELMLGIQITQDESGIKLDQEQYIEKMLRFYGMEDCKPVATPYVSGQRLEKPKEGHKPDDKIPYRALIGSLMYVAVCTRPDVAHTVNQLSQFNNCYTEEHWIAAKRVLRYLKGTKTFALTFTKERQDNLILGFCDADHGGDFDRKSNSGSVFLIQNGAIYWESKKQRTIALSSAEAEYVSLSEAATEAIFLRRLLSEISGQTVEAIPLFTDSQSAMAIAKNPCFHQRTKHIDVRYHFVREAIERGEIIIRYRETERMVADVLTKALPRKKLDWCVKGMGLNAK